MLDCRANKCKNINSLIRSSWAEAGGWASWNDYGGAVLHASSTRTVLISLKNRLMHWGEHALDVGDAEGYYQLSYLVSRTLNRVEDKIAHWECLKNAQCGPHSETLVQQELPFNR